MSLLVALTTLVIVTSIAVTTTIKSRAEAVIATSLVFNAIIIVPVYLLGLTNHLDRLTLGLSALFECAAILGLLARLRGPAFFNSLPKRFLVLAVLPLAGIRRAWQKRSLIAIIALIATAAFPYMLLVAYLAPAWREGDGLAYHESLIGTTIQNHGFAPTPLPSGLKIINGVQRLAEMTQLWFGIYGGRRVVDIANAFFMPLHAASVFVLVRRYSKDVSSGVAWASAMVLLPAFLRLVQSTFPDPQACALLLASAYYVTHPELDRKNALWAILATTLAAGAKSWSVVPITLLSVFLLVRLVRRRQQNGVLATAGFVSFGALCVFGIQAVTSLRNLLLPRINHHNEPFSVFVKKMLALPYSVMSKGDWQLNDYGFAWAWVVLPIVALVAAIVILRWFITFLATHVFRRRTPGPGDEALASATMLAVVASVSLFLSPAVFTARHHVASLGMLAGCLAWLAARWGATRFSDEVAQIAGIGSVIFMCWAPNKHEFVYLYDASQVVKWLSTPYPRRELEDIGTATHPKLLVAPANTATATLREKEVKRDSIVGFDTIEYYALLWNNEYSNKVVWLSGADPLGDAERQGMVWVYTRGGTTMFTQLSSNTSWELIGPLEAESIGSVWRRKK